MTRCIGKTAFFLTVVLISSSELAFSNCLACEPMLVELANPLQGTDSVPSFSHGNVYPAIALPFGMHAWAPYTQSAPDTFFYQFRQSAFRGIRLTHQPSPWIGDYGAFAVMPVSGHLRCTEAERASKYLHSDEQCRPSYYRVHLCEEDATIEVTPTKRCAAFRVTYEKSAPAYLVLDAFGGGSRVTILPNERRIIGIARNTSGSTPLNFANYFVIQFDSPFKSFGVWTPKETRPGVAEADGEHSGAYFEFDVSPGDAVTFRVASSFISHEQAQVSLDREIGDALFDDILSAADATWNDALGHIEVEGGTDGQRRTFYSCLYRSMLFPHAVYEVDAANKNRHYSPYDGLVHDGVMYTDSGLWDTFRAVHPLFNLLVPEVNAEILQGLLNAYDQSGWLPAWSSPGHRECMIGNHAFSLLADAWVKGNQQFDARKALAAMVHDASNSGPLATNGREGASLYNQLGYLPSPEIAQATAKTLEFAYDDYCVSVLARSLGEDEAADTFAKTSKNWRNVFDPTTQFVRGRSKGGAWLEPFFPDEWGGPFTEGNAWHWTWSVFHDIPGLIDAFGGRDAFVLKLDELFDVPPTVRPGSYGGLIHEMTEMIAINMGQYAHGNQPIQHMPYLYACAGQPWKTQRRVRLIMDRLYDSSPRGFCGDDDNGQTSAWYVFSALGFYPVTPGQPIYVMGSPLFPRATIHLPSGKAFVIEAEGNGTQSVFVNTATLNDIKLDRAWLNHNEIAHGGKLRLTMDEQANEDRATEPINFLLNKSD